MRFFRRLGCGLLLTAATAVPSQAYLPTAAPTATCPLLGSADWRAELAPSDGAHGADLTIRGVVKTPTPAYEFIWSIAPDEARDAETLRLHLDVRRKAGMAIQVLTDHSVSVRTPASPGRYKAVRILCGGEAIANRPVPLTPE